MDPAPSKPMTKRAGFWPTVAGVIGAGAGFVAGMDLNFSTTVIVTGTTANIHLSGDRNPIPTFFPATGKAAENP